MEINVLALLLWAESTKFETLIRKHNNQTKKKINQIKKPLKLKKLAAHAKDTATNTVTKAGKQNTK